jgi:hypothetical protein
MTPARDSQDLVEPAPEPGAAGLADYPQTMNKEVIFRG